MSIQSSYGRANRTSQNETRNRLNNPLSDHPNSSHPDAPRRKKLSWRKRIVFSAIATVGFFCALEGLLAIIGLAPVIETDDPFMGFSNQQPLMRLETDENGQSVIRTAPNKLTWFNEQVFPAEKKAGTKRVFCVGGSTTYGRPFDDTTSYVGWLRELLPEVDASTQWHVINAGGVSYASYRIAEIMQELAAYEPDLFIVYCGQNEFLERRTYEGFFNEPKLKTDFLAAAARTRTWALIDRAVKGSRSNRDQDSKLTMPGEVDEILNHTIGPSDYRRDDQWKSDVVQHYELNLDRMVVIARQANAEILFIVPASNEKDCSPFKSDSEARDLENAARQFQIGTDHFTDGSHEEASLAFRRAINFDVCPLRAIDAITATVQRVASQQQVPVVDFPSMLRERCLREHGHPCLGEEYFLDHVHPTRQSHRHLALWILDHLKQSAFVPDRKVAESGIDAIANRIESKVDDNASGVSLRNLAKVLHWSGKFDEAIPRARDALRLLHNDVESLAVLADCLAQTEKPDEAMDVYEDLFQIAPQYVRSYLPYGELLVRQGDFSGAKAYLVLAVAENWNNARASYFLGIAESELGNHELALDSLYRSLELYPENSSAMSALARVYSRQGDLIEATNWYQSAINLDPNDVESHFRLGMLMLKRSKPSLAKTHFETVLRLDPDHAMARSNLAIAEQLD